MNSLVIVLFLSGMVAMIMLRTLHKDIARYNQMDSVVSSVSLKQKSSEWKQYLWKVAICCWKLLQIFCRVCSNCFERVFNVCSIAFKWNSLLTVTVLLFYFFQEDAQEEFGWKLVHGDVFRPPRKGMLLSVFLGSGTQIFIMTFVTLCKCMESWR